MIHNNTDRAQRAKDCLLHEYNNNDLQTDMTDFLADLKHLCDRSKIDWNDVLKMAEWHHKAEIDEEGYEFKIYQTNKGDQKDRSRS
jgi:hypothetical protein